MAIMLITGASRGIGAATAVLAAQAGYTVVVNYNTRRDEAEGIVSRIRAGNGKATAIKADISREEEVVRLFAAVDEQVGRVQVLVNNAGILERQMRVEEFTAERLDRIFRVNITGQMICAREAIKHMSKKYGGKGGAIINVSSIAAKTGAPDEYVDYAASKGAMDSFTVGLAREVAGEGIRVNGVRPAFIYTDIHTAGGEPGRVNRIKESIPMKRGGQATEVAEAILWLASEKASYSTGTFIDVSGGR